MKRFILIFFFFSLILSAKANDNEIDFDLVANIDISASEFRKKYEYETTEYVLASGKKLGKFYSFNAEKVLLKHLGDAVQKAKVMIIAVREDNNVAIYSMDEFSNSINVLPPAFVFGEIHNTTGDTVVVPEIEGGMGELDMSFVDAELDAGVKLRVHLQMKSLSSAEVEEFFRTQSIIFPMDKATDRWSSNLKRISIYKLKD